MDAITGNNAGIVEIRSAQIQDLPSIAAIYNHYVLTSTCTFATEPPGTAYFESWLAEHTGPHAAVVAVRRGEVVGWGSLSTWNSRCAYQHTVEDSVYVLDECRGRGIGRLLLTELLQRAQAAGHRAVIAQIADHQAASETLHQQAGFRKVGVLESVGMKFDRWLDVSIWQLLLPATEHGPRPETSSASTQPIPHDRP